MKVESYQVQGNILHAYGTLCRSACHRFLAVHDAEAATRVIGGWLGEVSFGRGRDPGVRGVHLNLAFSYRGLEALGCPEEMLEAFPEDFRAGAVARSPEHVRDRGVNAPADWEEGLRGDSDVLLSVYGPDAECCRAFLDDRVREAAGAMRPVGERQDAGLLERRPVQAPADSCGVEFDREHFGFADGCSQPMIEGVDRQRNSSGVYGRVLRRGMIPNLLEDVGILGTKREWRLIRTGEFLLGYDDEDGRPPVGPPAPLGPNGTFMVYRKLEQDVDAFNDVIARAENELGRDHDLKAKVIGRTLDGEPLLPVGGNAATDAVAANAFTFADDRSGHHCPLGAHIRRTNPRNALPGGAEVTTRHRMIRRGMPYGPKFEDAPEEKRGLIFICYTSSIAQGFEFVQRMWCDEGQVFGLGDEPDYILQQDPMPMVIQGVGTLPAPERPLVTVRGCAYLFVPSRRALEWIAGLHARA